MESQGSKGSNQGNSSPENDEWLPDSAFATDNEVKALNDERQVLYPNETNAQAVRRLIEENSPIAVMGLVKIAKHGTNERTRLAAQQYIVDRVLGKIGDDVNAGEKDPLGDFLNDVSSYANQDHIADEEETE